MEDKIVRVLAKGAPVKASAITAKGLVERARQIHKTLPTATAALGRALMACSMMGNQLKEDNGAVTLQIKGGGPLGSITAVSDSMGSGSAPESAWKTGCGLRCGDRRVSDGDEGFGA